MVLTDVAPPADIRAADEDRERVATALRTHCEAGRLTIDELEERLAAAYAAKTLGDLDPLMADLPALPTRPAVTAAGHAAGAGGPGLRAFSQRYELGVSRDVAFRHALDHIVPAMVRFGYEISHRHDGHVLTFAIDERPGWVPFVCVFAFPIGLLALLARNRYTVTIEFDELPRGEGTVMRAYGRARRPVRKAFADLHA
jgi:Domain of unknown function (DUF1707)